MLWIALHLPRLVLEVFDRGRAADADAIAGIGGQAPPAPPGSAPPEPMAMRLAVCDRLQVLDACAAARAAGVEPGMRRATALALVPDLVVRERDQARELDALARVAGCALAFSPCVSLEPPDGLLLEVGASLKAFGGAASLLERLLAQVAALGFTVEPALAPTARGAWLLARAAARGLVERRRPPSPLQDMSMIGASAAASPAPRDARLEAAERAAFERALERLPAILLAGAQPHAGTFEGVGVRTIGDLLALPREGLARRFGPALLDELDRARGLAPEPRDWHAAPAAFSTRLELLAAIESADALLFAARRLLAELGGWLTARESATPGFTLYAHHDRRDAREPTAIEVRLASASRAADRFALLLRERLGTIELAAPVESLSLVCEDVLPVSAASGELFATPARAEEQLARLIERLAARLGPENVRRLLPADDHRPERAWRVELVTALPSPAATVKRARSPGAAGSAMRSAAASGEADAEPAGAREPDRLARPLWLLREPLPLAERGGRPCHFGTLALVAGPERIEGGWWDLELVQRDYFVAEGETGALYWVYVERGTSDAPAAWFLHGRFA